MGLSDASAGVEPDQIAPVSRLSPIWRELLSSIDFHKGGMSRRWQVRPNRTLRCSSGRLAVNQEGALYASSQLVKHLCVADISQTVLCSDSHVQGCCETHWGHLKVSPCLTTMTGSDCIFVQDRDLLSSE